MKNAVNQRKKAGKTASKLKNFRRLIRDLSLLLCCVCILAASVEAKDVWVISDFTDDTPLAGWKTESADDHGEIEVSLSKDKAAVGDASIKISYGPDQWRVAYLDFREREAEDWRGWDVLEFDLYNEGPHEIPYLRILVHNDTYRWARSAGKRIVGTTLNNIPANQWLRHTIFLRREPGTADPFTDIDRERVGVIRFMAHANHPFPETTNLYIDNLRLRNLFDQRIETLDKALSVLMNLEDPAEGREVENMLDQLKTINGQPQETPEEREKISRQLSDLEDEMTDLARRAAGARTRDYFQTISDIYVHAGLVEKSSPDLIPLDEPIIDLKEDQRVRALERISDILTEIKTEASLQADLQRYFADHDFAYGVPETPAAWTDDTYSGRMSGSINLQAARNEYEPAQIVVLAHKEALSGVKIELTDLTGENGRIAAEHIDVAPMGWRDRDGGSGRIADDLRFYIKTFDIEAGRHQPVWINVYVPKETPPGNYLGTATIEADGVEAQSIDVSLRVWPFTLPELTTLGTATWCSPAFRLPPGAREEYAEAVISRGWNPFQLYIWNEAPLPLDYMRKLTEMGAQMHNLMRISRQNPAFFEEGPDGRLQMTQRQKEWFFRRLDPIVEEIIEKDPDFMEHVALYGFDELPPAEIHAMDNLYGDFKERYHGIRTMFADLYGMWEVMPELPRNVDIWAVNRGTLTPAARDKIQNAGMKVFWYNLYSNQEDPVGNRVQFWSTVKDGLDGLLHYNLPGRNIMRVGTDNQPVPSVAFEYWREGMEDMEYVFLLRERMKKLTEKAGDDPTAYQRRLLHRGKRLTGIPENITTGLLGDRAVDVGEVVIGMTGHTDNMSDIMAVRTEIAELIMAIDRELGTAK